MIKNLEFPVLFLEVTPSDNLALYSLMNYADLLLGLYNPMGGMNKVIEAKTNLNRIFSDKYWYSGKLAPSVLLFFLRINKKIKNLRHHYMRFDQHFVRHADKIYKHSKRAIYISLSSKTDSAFATEGFENVTMLMPVSIILDDKDEICEKYDDLAKDRLECITGDSVKPRVILKKKYSRRDFIKDYHSFKVNAYGLADTLMKKAIFKLKMKSKKVDNLFYCLQWSVSGAGVPFSIISGEVASNMVIDYEKNHTL